MANKRERNTAKSKPEAPAVKTYADHEVIVPAHRLRAAVVMDTGESGPDPVLQAARHLWEIALAQTFGGGVKQSWFKKRRPPVADDRPAPRRTQVRC